jgi:hemolysin III
LEAGEKFNSLSHLLGAALALAGAIPLVVFAALQGDGYRTVSFSVYGASLFFLYLVSTLYHGLSGRAKRIFQVLDHQAIYLLIAGTYTPFTLVTLRGTVGWWLFGAVWGLAVLGMALDALRAGGRRILPLVIYLTMGWLVVLALDPLLETLPKPAFAVLLAGGLFYTLGVIFYLLDHRYPWSHPVWHLFVLGGSISHFWVIAWYL